MIEKFSTIIFSRGGLNKLWTPLGGSQIYFWGAITLKGVSTLSKCPAEPLAALYNNVCTCWQANLAIQEARYGVAMSDLNGAQAQLDEKQRELDVVQAQYDAAMSEKQVQNTHQGWCDQISPNTIKLN